MSTQTNQNDLIHRKLQIQLFAEDPEVSRRNLATIESMPIINGICILKRKFFTTWGYVVKLDQPLYVDSEGFSDEVRKKYSTKYVAVYFHSTDIYKDKDPLYLELSLKSQNSISKSGELHTFVRYISDPSNLPNEIEKNDPILNEIPVLCWGATVKLID